MTELIITNGDSAAELLHAAGYVSPILSWRDVLHDGPVPETPDLLSLSDVRARFLADDLGLPLVKVRRAFETRDRMVLALTPDDRVTLWFEHDLYDQLQLIQVIDLLLGTLRQAKVFLVQADDYLGRQTPETIGRFEAVRGAVSADQATLATRAWAAFRRDDPTRFADLLNEELSPMPFLASAVLRMLEELPDIRSGLSRTEWQILTAIDAGIDRPARLFGAVQRMEQFHFMGDWSFFRRLDGLVFSDQPLVVGLPHPFAARSGVATGEPYVQAPLELTDFGRAIMAGAADHAVVNRIDRWFGGTHLTPERLWRWDAERRTLSRG